MGEADANQALDVTRYESLGFHRGPQPGRIHGRAIMANWAAFSASAAASAGLPGATIAQPSMKI